MISQYLQYYLKHKLFINSHSIFDFLLKILRKKFTTSHLSMILVQFLPKSVTKYLNFSLMICVYWHSSEYTFSMQYSSLNMKSTVNRRFIYRHVYVSRSVNLIAHLFTSRIFIISITRSWTDDDGAIVRIA